MENSKVLSIRKAAKHFNFPINKLYKLVDDRACPFIEQKNLSGSISIKINTYSFGLWLHKKAMENESI